MTGIERITKERERQISEKGYTPEHDDKHHNQEIAKAAACYTAPCYIYMHILTNRGASIQELWPWGNEWDKRIGRESIPKSPQNLEDIDIRIRDLEKAGALCAAEIDRLLRKKVKIGLQA